jgi:hypothetical protein
MAGRQAFEFPRGFRMIFQHRAQFGGNWNLSRFAVEAQFQADQISGISAGRLAKGRIELHAVAAAAGGKKGGPDAAAVDNRDNGNVVFFAGLLFERAANFLRDVDMSHHPDAVDRSLKPMGLMRAHSRKVTYAVVGFRWLPGIIRQKAKFSEVKRACQDATRGESCQLGTRGSHSSQKIRGRIVCWLVAL